MDNMELNPRNFGLNGEALASLSDISVVEVRTKARGRPNSYCKIIKASSKLWISSLLCILFIYTLLMHLNFLLSIAQGSKCLHLGIDDQREVVGTTGNCSIFFQKWSSTYIYRYMCSHDYWDDNSVFRTPDSCVIYILVMLRYLSGLPSL